MLFVLFFGLMPALLWRGDNQKADRQEQATKKPTGKSKQPKSQPQEQTTQAERAVVLLRICFPNAVYKADAAPACPAFKEYVTEQADKNEGDTKNADHDN